MARKLPGLVRGSALQLVDVQVHMTVTSELSGEALARVDDIMNTLVPAAWRGRVDVTAAELEQWHAEVHDIATAGEFFFAEPTVVAVAHRRRETD